MLKFPFSLLRSRFLKTDLACEIHSSTKAYAKLNVCVVGSGPSGFYTAQRLIKNNDDIHVDLYEQMHSPLGLIRYGIAPDHPELKAASEVFTEVMETGQCSFYGHANISGYGCVRELLQMYNAVVLAYGASEHNHLGVPGEDLTNVVSANEFVGWYNGHPQYYESHGTRFNLDTETAAIIGTGNVALDIARILLRRPQELKNTDIANHAFEALEKSKIKKVYLIGRKGPLNAAFTLPEFREMTKVPGCQTVMHPEDLKGVVNLLSTMTRGRRRAEFMLDTVEASMQQYFNSRQLDMKFFRTPKIILPDENNKVIKMVLTVNDWEGRPDSGEVFGTDREETLDCGLVIKSIGFRSIKIDEIMPFDPIRCIVPNKRGKVGGERGLYCSGWLKTGPKGIIPNTIVSSYETADTILSDFKTGACPTDLRPGSKEILERLKVWRGIEPVEYSQWRILDNIERRRGMHANKPREKIARMSEVWLILSLPLESCNLFRIDEPEHKTKK